MATLIASNPELFKSDNPMETIKKLILSGQSWKQGQWLFTDTSDLLKACASNAAAGTGGIKYVALSDRADPGNSTTQTEVGVITADMIWLMNDLDGAVVAADIGTHVAIDVTANVVTADLDDTGNDALEIVDIMANLNPAQYNVVDTLAKILCKVLPAALEAAQA